MLESTRLALVDQLSSADSVVEIGIGRRVSVAHDLATAGVDVTATDVHEREVSPDVRFVIDDVTAPDLSVYAGADVIYALNLPPELHRPARDIAEAVGARLCFTTLGGDQPELPVTRLTIPGETLYLVE